MCQALTSTADTRHIFAPELLLGWGSRSRDLVERYGRVGEEEAQGFREGFQRWSTL